MSEKIEMPSSDYCAKKTVNIVSLEDFLCHTLHVLLKIDVLPIW